MINGKHCFELKELEKNIYLLITNDIVELEAQDIFKLVSDKKLFCLIIHSSENLSFSFGAIQILASIDNIVSLSLVSKKDNCTFNIISKYIKNFKAHYPVKNFRNMASSITWSKEMLQLLLEEV